MSTLVGNFLKDRLHFNFLKYIFGKWKPWGSVSRQSFSIMAHYVALAWKVTINSRQAGQISLDAITNINSYLPKVCQNLFLERAILNTKFPFSRHFLPVLG